MQSSKHSQLLTYQHGETRPDKPDVQAGHRQVSSSGRLSCANWLVVIFTVDNIVHHHQVEPPSISFF